MPPTASLAVFDTLTERRDTRNPLYLQAKTCLREAILANRIGERLPSERDLAKRFGVSFMTARRAVSDLVDEGLLLRRHGKGTYVRQPGLDARPALAIGVLVSEDPALATLAHAVRRAAQAAGHGTVVLGTTWADLVPIASDHPCPKLPLAGLIGLGVTAALTAETARAALHLPLVLVDAESPISGCDLICADHAAVARHAVEHLHQLGHRRIAFLGGVGPAAERRAIGFRMAMRRLGLPELHERPTLADGVEAAVARLIPRLPTALVCADDALAESCLRAFQARGLQVPRDLSLLACDATVPAAFADPRISCVAVSRDELAQAAVQRLVQRFSGSAVAESPSVVTARLIARASTAVVAAG